MMHRNIFVLLILAATVSPAAYAQQQESPSEYGALLARVKEGDLSIDFKQLRISYMESPERRKARNTFGEYKAMFEALEARDYERAIQNADIVLENDFVNLDAHLVEEQAYEQLHRQKEVDFHDAVLHGLLGSIYKSGDGKSPETAFVLISTDEETPVLLGLHLESSNHTTLEQGGHWYDVVEAKNRHNRTFQVYFNVDIPLKQLKH